MRKLIWYIRSMWCNHEWVQEEKYIEVTYGGLRGDHGIKVNATCKKCGWCRKYWKWM